MSAPKKSKKPKINKAEAVRKAEALIASGTSYKDAAKRCGINTSLIGYYRRKAKLDKSPKQASGKSKPVAKPKKSVLPSNVYAVSASKQPLEVELKISAGVVKVSGDWRAVFSAVQILESKTA